MAVDRADVVKAEFLEQRTRRQHALDVLSSGWRELEQRRCRRAPLAGAARGVEGAAGDIRRCEILVQRPTGGEIDMSLSLGMTSRSASATPALFSASKPCRPTSRRRR